MPGKEVLNGLDSSANGATETFLFTSESVGEGHPGNKKIIISNVCYPVDNEKILLIVLLSYRRELDSYQLAVFISLTR